MRLTKIFFFLTSFEYRMNLETK